MLVPGPLPIEFEKVTLDTATGFNYTTLVIGPDGMLYAATLTGQIVRFPLNADGTTGAPTVIDTIRTAAGGANREVLGLAFDPQGNLWVSHSAFGFDGG